MLNALDVQNMRNMGRIKNLPNLVQVNALDLFLVFFSVILCNTF